VVDVQLLNERHGSDFVVAGAYPGGEGFAVRLVDGRGRRFVLKGQGAGLAPATTEALRSQGYPAPRYVLWGDGYHVQEELPGAPVETSARVPVGIRQRLLELNELQAGRAVDADGSWPERVIESVVVGLSDYMILATLEDHSEDTRRLLRLCQRAVERHAGALSTTRDIVHWDFTYRNILCAEQLVSGVIDWGGTCSGDRLFDLATIVYYTGDAAPEICEYVLDRIGPEGLSVYHAHLAIRQSDWSLRRHTAKEADRVVAHSLQLALRFP
jgi:aminoglycoside phosphotransferase (APT) family kinase protein